MIRVQELKVYYISPKPIRASTPVLPKPQEGVYIGLLVYGSQIRDEGLGATILGGT